MEWNIKVFFEGRFDQLNLHFLTDLPKGFRGTYRQTINKLTPRSVDSHNGYFPKPGRRTITSSTHHLKRLYPVWYTVTKHPGTTITH